MVVEATIFLALLLGAVEVSALVVLEKLRTFLAGQRVQEVLVALVVHGIPFQKDLVVQVVQVVLAVPLLAFLEILLLALRGTLLLALLEILLLALRGILLLALLEFLLLAFLKILLLALWVNLFAFAGDLQPNAC